MNARAEGAVHGAIAGVIGASCMTVLRMAARRQGLVEKEAPQAVEAWLLRRRHAQSPRALAPHQALSTLLHLGYGLVWGAGWGVAVDGKRPGIPWGLLYGGLQTLVGIEGLLPAMGVTPPPRALPLRSHLVTAAAHALFGAVLAFVSQELARQEETHARRGRETWMHRTPQVA